MVPLMTAPMLGARPEHDSPARKASFVRASLAAATFATVAMGVLYSSPAVAQTAAAPAAETTPVGYPDCTIAPDEAATQAAQGAFQAGNASFNEADYPRAIVYWEDAYRRDCTAHLMLKNLARAYELHEQYEHAIVALKTFIDRNPESPEREALQRRIENLQQKLDERARAAAAAAPPSEPTPEPRPVQKPPERNLLEEKEEFPPGTEEPDSGRSALPLVFTGVGVAAGVVGGALWYVAKNDAASAEEQCGGDRRGCTDEVAQKGNDAVNDQRLWTIVGGVGAAVAVGGLIWYFAQPVDNADTSRLTPLIGTEFAGLNYQGRF
jgi:hypothetical protein